MKPPEEAKFNRASPEPFNSFPTPFGIGSNSLTSFIHTCNATLAPKISQSADTGLIDIVYLTWNDPQDIKNLLENLKK